MRGIVAPDQLLSIERLPVQNFMPPEAREFRNANYVAMPAQGAQAVVVQFTVPQGYNGLINRFGNVFVGGGFQEGAGLITYTLYADFNPGIVATGFNNIRASLGSIVAPTILNGIKIKENQVVTLVVNNANPGVVPAGQLVGGIIGGFYYPVQLEPKQIAFAG